MSHLFKELELMLNIMHIEQEGGKFSAQLVCGTVGSMKKKHT